MTLTHNNLRRSPKMGLTLISAFLITGLVCWTLGAVVVLGTLISQLYLKRVSVVTKAEQGMTAQSSSEDSKAGGISLSLSGEDSMQKQIDARPYVARPARRISPRKNPT